MKINDRWILFELLKQHAYINSHGYDNKPYPGFVKKSESRIILQTKKILGKTISNKDIDKLTLEIENYFYEKLLVHEGRRINPLGPIGSAQIIINQGQFLDIEDIEEVHVNKEDFSGSIKTKSVGWISWIHLKNSENDFQYLVSMSHFNQDNSIKDLYEKVFKYKQSKTGRKIKEFFVSNSHWFDEDLEKLWRSLPYTQFLNY